MFTVDPSGTLSRQSKPILVPLHSESPISLSDKACCWMLTFGITLWVATDWLDRRWLLGLFQLTIFVATVLVLLKTEKSKQAAQTQAMIAFAFALPFVGYLQLTFGLAGYRYATLLATLNWATFACMAFIGTVLLTDRGRREFFFRTLLVLAGTVTAMELYQIFILGRYSLMSTSVPLLSSNAFAELAELLLPVSLFLSLRPHWTSKVCFVVSPLMFATVIASAARAGTVIAGLELLIWCGHWLVRGDRSNKRARSIVFAIVIFSSLLALAEGAELLTARLSETNPLAHRRDVLISAVNMFKSHPWFGMGLGCFPIAYPEFQRYDSVYLINHVHNDLVEVVADGGVASLVAWLGFLIFVLKTRQMKIWGIGCLGLLAHSFFDFPFYRPAVCSLFALLTAGLATQPSKLDQKS